MVTPGRTVERKSRALTRMRAKGMRRKPAVTEKHFWNEVRDRKLGGYKFKRQYLIGSYIADFACVERKVIVELDGVRHAGRGGYDLARDKFLQDNGWRVMRFKNEDFLGDIAVAMTTILHELTTPSPRPSPPLRGREGED